MLFNTGIAHARDPLRMARAMRLACEAGRLAYLAGRIPKKLYATASSPSEGMIAAGKPPPGREELHHDTPHLGRPVARRKRGQAPSPQTVLLGKLLSRRRSQSPFSTADPARSNERRATR